MYPMRMLKLRIGRMLRMMALLLTLAIMMNSCAGWTINGVSVEKFRKAAPPQQFEMCLGALTSVAVHTLGHIAYLESKGKRWHLSGFYEMVDDPLTDSEARVFGRAGFVTQLAVGTMLKSSKWNDSWFVTGYYAGCALEIWAYPAIHPAQKGDLAMIEMGKGDRDIEWATNSLWAAGLLMPKNEVRLFPLRLGIDQRSGYSSVKVGDSHAHPVIIVKRQLSLRDKFPE